MWGATPLQTLGRALTFRGKRGSPDKSLSGPSGKKRSKLAKRCRTRRNPLKNFLWLIAFCMISCSHAAKEGHTFPPSGWQRLDAGSFSIYAPTGWQFQHVRSVDSYMGRFLGDGVTLGFDFGMFADSVQDSQMGPTYLVSDEIIGGCAAKLGCPRTPGHGRTAIYFHKVQGSDNSLLVSGQDLSASQQELALQVFRTIRFKEQTAPPSN